MRKENQKPTTNANKVSIQINLLCSRQGAETDWREARRRRNYPLTEAGNRVTITVAEQQLRQGAGQGCADRKAASAEEKRDPGRASAAPGQRKLTTYQAQANRTHPFWKGRKQIRSRIPVTMTKGFHLFPSRTQKLSPSVPKVVDWRRSARIGRCRIPYSSVAQWQSTRLLTGLL